MGEIITTLAGAVEVEVIGQGQPILILHGSPGGIDAAVAMSHFLTRNKFRSICLSRPGYLNTPLDPVRRSIDHEADLLAALLDKLNIRRVGVLAWSGGGPSAYRLAVRHPDRVSSLVVVAAVSGRWVAPKYPLADRLISGTTVGERLVRYMGKKSPEHLVEEALKGEGSVRGKALQDLVNEVIINSS